MAWKRQRPNGVLHYSDDMPRSWSLSAKLGAIGAALLLMAFASIGLTLWVTWQLEGGAAAVNEAGRMRMQTWRLAQTLERADEAAEGCAVRTVRQQHRGASHGRPGAAALRSARSRLPGGLCLWCSESGMCLKAAWGTSPAPGAERAAQAGRRVREPHRHLRLRHPRNTCPA